MVVASRPMAHGTGEHRTGPVILRRATALANGAEAIDGEKEHQSRRRFRTFAAAGFRVIFQSLELDLDRPDRDAFAACDPLRRPAGLGAALPAENTGVVFAHLSCVLSLRRKSDRRRAD